MDLMEINSLVLAYLGDTIYENYVRKFLINQKIANVNDLQKEAIKYVSAKNQAKYVKDMLAEEFFSDLEVEIIMRGRNYKTTSHPKNTKIADYKYATGLEALIGYLELNKEYDRIEKIMSFILGGKK